MRCSSSGTGSILSSVPLRDNELELVDEYKAGLRRFYCLLRIQERSLDSIPSTYPFLLAVVGDLGLLSL